MEEKFSLACADAADEIIHCFTAHGFQMPTEHDRMLALMEALSKSIAEIVKPALESEAG